VVELKCEKVDRRLEKKKMLCSVMNYIICNINFIINLRLHKSKDKILYYSELYNKRYKVYITFRIVKFKIHSNII